MVLRYNLLFFLVLLVRAHWLFIFIFIFFNLRIALGAVRNQIEENFIISSSEGRQ